MIDEVAYRIDELPFDRARAVSVATHAHSEELLEVAHAAGVSPEVRDFLFQFVTQALHTMHLRGARALVPPHDLEMVFVDDDTFVEAMAAFLRSSPTTPPPIDHRSVRRKLLEKLCSYPTTRRVLERRCQGNVRRLMNLAGASGFSPYQVLSEIEGFLDLLDERSPRCILEIGTASGGMLFLMAQFAHPKARLVSIDQVLERRERLCTIARRSQELLLIEGDSHDPTTAARTRAAVTDVDVLFIDGDHSLEGAKRDFERYGPWVRPGGLIVFHDIVQDNLTRFGVDTGGWSGGVPLLWRELREQFATREFIGHPEQDGFGIGVVFIDDPISAGGQDHARHTELDLQPDL